MAWQSLWKDRSDRNDIGTTGKKYLVYFAVRCSNTRPKNKDLEKSPKKYSYLFMVKENEQMRDWGRSFILLQKSLSGTEPGI